MLKGLPQGRPFSWMTLPIFALPFPLPNEEPFRHRRPPHYRWAELLIAEAWHTAEE